MSDKLNEVLKNSTAMPTRDETTLYKDLLYYCAINLIIYKRGDEILLCFHSWVNKGLITCSYGKMQTFGKVTPQNQCYF